ncbi:MAG: isopenicillin N synthase family dioxygenase [Sandaracinaceae bacterium]
MAQQSIPVVSLRRFHDDRDAFSRMLFEALSDLGFVAVEDHGIDPACFERVYTDFAAFFALPEETKRAYEDVSTGRARGYTSFGVEHAKDRAVPDLKEFFHVGRDVDSALPRLSSLSPNLWPSEVATLASSTRALFDALDTVAAVLLEALSLALGLAPDHLPDLARQGNSVLRVIHYPAVDERPPGAMRAAEHEDINLITLLPPSPQAGLEILTRDGSWLPIHAIEGQIIVDTGDMMSRITHGKVPATTHRVVDDGASGARYSMPFFVHPHTEARLESLPGCVPEGEAPTEPIRAIDFLDERLKDIGLR